MTRYAHRALTTLLLAFTLVGCHKSLLKKYGYGRYPPVRVSEDPGFGITLPENAPSISQHYRPPSRLHDEDSTDVHEGIDIVGSTGTPVLAAASGRVRRSHLTLGRGNLIVIEHGKDAKGRIVRTKYAHLSKRRVREGDRVARGQRIGDLGMTGLTAGFPHLHFEVAVVRKDADYDRSIAVNPHLFWAGGQGVVTCFDQDSRSTAGTLKMTYPVPCR